MDSYKRERDFTVHMAPIPQSQKRAKLSRRYAAAQQILSTLATRVTPKMSFLSRDSAANYFIAKNTRCMTKALFSTEEMGLLHTKSRKRGLVADICLLVRFSSGSHCLR